MGNIRDDNQYHNSFWDWKWLNKCFTRNIRVSDIDGIIERNGKFLVIETKAPDHEVEEGQRKMHDSLVRDKEFWVIILEGDPNKPTRMTMRVPEHYQGGIIATESTFPTNAEEVATIVAKWYKLADANVDTTLIGDKK